MAISEGVAFVWALFSLGGITVKLQAGQMARDGGQVNLGVPLHLADGPLEGRNLRLAEFSRGAVLQPRVVLRTLKTF